MAWPWEVDGSKTFLQMFYFTFNHGLRRKFVFIAFIYPVQCGDLRMEEMWVDLGDLKTWPFLRL